MIAIAASFVVAAAAAAVVDVAAAVDFRRNRSSLDARGDAMAWAVVVVAAVVVSVPRIRNLIAACRDELACPVAVQLIHSSIADVASTLVPPIHSSADATVAGEALVAAVPVQPHN